jgi:hypothetical protein
MERASLRVLFSNTNNFNGVPDGVLGGRRITDLPEARITGVSWLEPGSWSGTAGGLGAIHVVRFPVWPILLVLLVLPLFWFRTIRRRGGFYLGRLKGHEPGPSPGV